MNAMTETVPHAREGETLIRVKGLYKIFGDDPEAMMGHVRAGMGKDELQERYGHVLGLQDIDIDMKAGEITVVMGLSGSGKSTLIRHLNLLVEPTAGVVEVDGTDVTTLSVEELRRMRRERMSMVFQKFALLPHRTVVQNAAMPLEVQGVPVAEREAEARRWLDRVGLGGYAESWPNQLSGGQQQRVGIARALTSNADIMLMDEAFSALDPLIRTDMQDLLLELQAELHKTIVFITHDLDEALKLADHLVILNDGAIAQQGEPQEILLNPADSYVEDFVRDINRARVLRVASVMDPHDPALAVAGTVEASERLEAVIAKAGGDTSLAFQVEEEGRPVGTLHMRDLVRALVPREPEGG
ncbi:glycine betaine/proline transport system ATP-binding protein [Hasllibacter halocynthiae]|uniref:Quaternary amine transport ATP-binding protein n=1 Tax=Hasllibacter halocynthiae TaxID=595589 RepID=A0A2T0X2H6_9RHOB|nr:betaine/proline/choline family ABC transporter ATP-binding protein [Hasllibacter halocynthiae]PRY93149.1 glycine betaine/proline transport system ATP-binding protein [Hasllibacter halocynthiae]